MIQTPHGIERKDAMASIEPREPHEATGHFDTFGVSGESCSQTRTTCREGLIAKIDAKLSWPLFCYIVGGLIAIGVLIGGYWINRTEAANDKCAALAERMSSSERDRETMRVNIQDMRDSLKEIERFIREKK